MPLEFISIVEDGYFSFLLPKHIEINAVTQHLQPGEHLTLKDTHFNKGSTKLLKEALTGIVFKVSQ